MCDDIDNLSKRKFETLLGVFIRASDLIESDLKWLLENGFIHTEWSDYGYKLSDKGFLAIGEPF